MPSGLQTEWRNEIGLSSEFIQRSKDNTNYFHCYRIYTQPQLTPFCFCHLVVYDSSFHEKECCLAQQLFWILYIILSRLFLSCANLITDDYIKYYGILENHCSTICRCNLCMWRFFAITVEYSLSQRVEIPYSCF